MIKVLLITSNYSLERMLMVTLTINGLSVFSVSHLSDGTALLEKNDFNIILLDSDFGDVSETIRLKGFTVPILVLGEIRLKTSLFDVDFILKPFEFTQLKVKMNQIFKRPRNLEEKLITSGELKIDVQQQMVMIKDKMVNLGKMELAILVSLARKTGKMVSRERMRLDLEAQGHFFNTTIFPHIKNLKRKLREVAGEKLQIKLIMGEGYQLLTNVD
jgi:DNA-binding response OmpR family regulator